MASWSSNLWDGTLQNAKKEQKNLYTAVADWLLSGIRSTLAEHHGLVPQREREKWSRKWRERNQTRRNQDQASATRYFKVMITHAQVGDRLNVDRKSSFHFRGTAHVRRPFERWLCSWFHWSFKDSVSTVCPYSYHVACYFRNFPVVFTLLEVGRRAN